MMISLFYICAVCFLYEELMWILYPKKQVQKMVDLVECRTTFKNLKWNDYSKQYKDLIIYTSIPSVMLLSWFVIGLFTFNWFAFALIIIFNTIIIAPISKLVEYKFSYLVLHWINSIIGFAFGVFIILNEYKLRIDLWEVINNWL